MSRELENYKKEVEAQKEELAGLLAEIGVGSNYDIDVDIPEGTPLAELFVGIKIAAENLAVVSDELNDRIAESEKSAEVIRAQSETIMELSTPVIQIFDEVLLAPLVGTIDTRRAQQIIEDLLYSIVKHQSAIVIMDITGVPVIDTRVADHFLKTIAAAKLLGAEVILTGVSPSNAETLVKLGIDLGGITTKISLQAGIALALELTERTVVEKK